MVCGVLRGLWSYRDSKELKRATIITDVGNRATGINIYNYTSYFPVFIYLQNSCLYKAIILPDQIFFQTKLNCEILDDAKAFEVRWAIAGKSIVTQLVARYIMIS